MSCCSDFFLHDFEHHGSGRAGGNPPFVSSFGGIVRIIPDAHPSLALGTGLRPSKFIPDEFVAALLPPYKLVYGCTRRFARWAERSEAQRVHVMTLGFTRTAFEFSPTCLGAVQ